MQKPLLLQYILRFPYGEWSKVIALHAAVGGVMSRQPVYTAAVHQTKATPFPAGESLIIAIILLLRILQVLQGLGLHVDGEVPALVAADRNPIEAHLPAVQVAVNTEVGVGKFVVDEIPTRREGHFPLGRDADITVKSDGVHMSVGSDAHKGGISD